MGILDAPVASLIKDSFGRKIDQFRPLRDLPRTILHFDASLITGYTDGAKVPIWRDQIHGQDAVQGTVANQPTMKIAGQNGLNYLTFGATASLLCSTFGAAGWDQPTGYAQPNTVFVVYRMPVSPANVRRCIVGMGISNQQDIVVQTISTDCTIAPVAGVQGSRGGPPANDNLWHVAAVVFDVNSTSVYIDGYLITANTANAGTHLAGVLLIGSNGSGYTFQGDIAEYIFCNAKVTRKEIGYASAALAKKWGIPTTQLAAPQGGVTFYDTTSSNGQAIRVWLPDTRTSSTLILWCHPANQNEQITPGYFSYPFIHAAVRAGYAVVASNQHGASTWANDNALNDLRNAYDWYVSNIQTPTKVILAGASMGGVSVSLAVAGQTITIPNVAGVIGFDAVFSLASMYSQSTYNTQINTAYACSTGTLAASTIAGATSISSTVSYPNGTQLILGATTVTSEIVTVNGAPSGAGPFTLPITAATAAHTSGDQVSDYPTKTAGHDPMLKTANSLSGPRWRFYPSPDDTLVIKATNSDAMAAKLGTATTPPAEYAEVVHVGVHLSNFACYPLDLMQFIARCIA